jgi:hypothetical protein
VTIINCTQYMYWNNISTSCSTCSGSVGTRLHETPAMCSNTCVVIFTCNYQSSPQDGPRKWLSSNFVLFFFFLLTQLLQ